jgi:hypothetical protein
VIVVKRYKYLVLLAIAMIWCGQAQAGTLFDLYGTNPASGNALHVQAEFTIGVGELMIELRNLGDAAKVPSDILHGLFFDVTGSPTFSPVIGSAIASAVVGDGVDSNNTTLDFNKEWEYKNPIGEVGYPAYGIGSAGYGIFGDGNFASSGNQPTDGLDYGIVNGIAGNANGPTQDAISANNEMTFKLSFSGTVNESDIHNVQAQYGTSLSDPHLVPEPSSLVVLGSSTLGMMGYLLRRRRKV